MTTTTTTEETTTVDAAIAIATANTHKQSTRKRKVQQHGSTQSTTITTTSVLNRKKMKRGKNATTSTTSSFTRTSRTTTSTSRIITSNSSQQRWYGLVTTPDPVPRERIPQFDREIKPLLERAGYRFGSHIFAFPNMDPRTNPRAVLGRDYFDTLEAFRTHLCQYGLDYDDNIFWDEQNCEKLRIWIRYNIIPFLNEGDLVPMIEGLIDKEAGSLLLHKCGIKYVGGFYVLPHVDRRQYCELPGPHQTKFRDRRCHDGLYAHLARFGFAASRIDTTQLTRQEHLSLALYVASGNDPNTFKRLHYDDFDFQPVPIHAASRVPSNSAPTPVSQVSNEEE